MEQAKILDDFLKIRTILSENIKIARKQLFLSQAKLAEMSDISLPHLTDIERCRTWVSDKTLMKISYALHMEPYQLLTPKDAAIAEQNTKTDFRKRAARIATMIQNKKNELGNEARAKMDDLTARILNELGR